MERNRTHRQHIHERNDVTEMRTRSNLLPFKSLIYAISTAMLNCPKPKREHLKPHHSALGNQMKLLDAYATRIQRHNDPDPIAASETLRTGTDSYVDIFYAMSSGERDAYIKAISARKYTIRRANNMLYIPAIMSEAGEEIGLVRQSLFRHLYAMPFKVLYNSSKVGLRVALMEDSMAIKRVKIDVIQDFAKSVSTLDNRIKEILDGKISPTADERMKSEFISGAVRMSEETDINIAEIISDRVRTDRHLMREMRRLVRNGITIPIPIQRRKAA